MAKIDIPNISSPYASQNALNVRFKMIEDALNDKVLWRDNPIGEVNTLKNDIDLGNNDLLNVGVVSASSIIVQGQGLEEGITEAVARCIEKADEAEDARVGAEQAQAAAESAATTVAADAVAAADSLLSSYVSSAEDSKNAAAQSAAEAEASANAAANAASTAASDTVTATSSLLSSYLTGAESAQTAAEAAATNAAISSSAASASANAAASDAAVASAAASTATTASSLSSGYATSAEQAQAAAEAAQTAAEIASANAEASANGASASAASAANTVASATPLLSGFVTSAEAAQTAAEQAKTAAETAAGTAASDAVADASSLLSGYVASANASKNAAEQSAIVAVASANRAETAAEQAAGIPIASPGDEGKVLTISPSLEREWAEIPEVADELPPYSVTEAGKILKVSSLGEVEWGVEGEQLPPYTASEAGKTLTVNGAGDAVEWAAPPIESVNIAPQTIVRAPVGSRPTGWTAADCDAPVHSMSAESAVIVNNDVLPVFSGSNSSGGMTVSAKAQRGDYYVWKAFNKQSVNYRDCWVSGEDFARGTGVGSSWIQVDMGRQVNVARIVLYPRNEDGTFLTDFPHDFDIVIDGVKVKEVRDAIPPSRTARMEFDLDSPVTGQVVRLDIMRTGGNIFTGIGQFYVYDAEVVGGSALVQIAAGLQVAYADEGRVQLSEVLYSAHALDLSSAATGVYYIYANIAADGRFTTFGYTANQPMVGTERSGAGDLYNPATVTMYDTNDNPIRRVYLGRVEKVGGVITDVHCYSLGTSATIPLVDSNAQPMSTYVKFLGFLMANGSCRVEFYASPHWFEAPAMVAGSTSFGVFDRVLTPVTFRFKTGDNLGSHPETASPVTQAKARLVIQRGY